MKTSFASLAAAIGLASAAAIDARSTVEGFDVSHYQGTINWSGAYTSGARFVYIKATEGTTYVDPNFSTNYEGATAAGLLRGGYHFAEPDSGTGAAQAQFFVKNGGGWSADGQTLPGMIDLEYNPSGSECYGLSASAMVSWIQSFATEYHSLTKRYPVIYTTTDWWTTCTGNSAALASTCPLFIARYSSTPGTLPSGWSTWTFWQFDDSFSYGGDSDVYNGSLQSLKRFAKSG